MARTNSKKSNDSPQPAGLRIYNAWKKQYMADVLRPQYPKIKENSKFMVKKLKNAYTAVTQEDKDTILAEL